MSRGFATSHVSRTTRAAGMLVAALAAVACAHSEPFGPVDSTVGPAASGPDVQLTFNTDQDYWPAWTADGKGVL